MSVTSSSLMPLVRKLDYWAEFDAADEKAILDLPHRTKRLERHGYVVREREKTTHSCLMISGFAIRHKIVAGGARQIVAIHMKGDMVDLQNSFLGVADHSVQVLTESDVAFIPREAIKKLAFDRPNVGMAMWFDTLVDGSIFREWIANVGRRDAQCRVAHLLCEFSLRLKVAGLGVETEYELPMTQEQIADTTGLTPVHVNRTLKSLEARGLIERRSSRTVTIGDWKKLAEAGDFDSNYLHLRENEAALN
jgi:CRP-like cAMP-binding protein